MKANIDAFMYPDRNSSKKRRRALVYQYVQAVVYDACRAHETPAASFFNPHGKSWSSIAQRIIDWITQKRSMGALAPPPAPFRMDGPVAHEMWNDFFKNKPPYPFGSPVLFAFMLECENAPESYAFAPEAIKQDPDVYFPYAMRGVEDAAERAMRSILMYVHLPTKEEMRDFQPVHGLIARYTGNTPGNTPEDFVSYLKGIEALANNIAQKVESEVVQEMHGELLMWLHSPDRPLGRQTLEDARQDFETTERQRSIEAARLEFKKRQATQPVFRATKKMRQGDLAAFDSMVAFHGKAAVQRWRIAEHVCVV